MKNFDDKKIALERVKILFNEAERAFKKNPERSNRYVELARKVAMRARLRISSELKRRFCKYCKKYLVPGANLRVRTNKNRVVYLCLECNKIMRFPFAKEKKVK